MSEEPKKTNRYITRYEQIYQKLAKVTSIYLKKKDEDYYKKFILRERGINQTNLTNSLIELPNGNVKDVIRQQYISENINTGEIGTIDPEDQVYEIRNMALLMLMSNRLSKEYKYILENSERIDETTKVKYEKNERDLLVWKNNAVSDLIASIYVLEKTAGEEYEGMFSYGEYKDVRDRSTFVIDLPYIGQIGIHFGPEKMNNIEDARNKAISILERKQELGQIDSTKLEELIEEISMSEILPEYKGRLYEYTSALPIEYIGPTAQSIIRETGLDTKLPEEIEQQDVQKMIESGLNEREAYYLAIKLGFPKKQLKEVIKSYDEISIQDDMKMGVKAVRTTTAQERENILRYEQKNIERYIERMNYKVIGGE